MGAGFGLILTGLIFFFNPFFNMLDVLPDFIGCIFIIKGLSKISLLDGNLESATKSAKYLLWLSVAKLVLAFWTNAGRTDYLLPFTFIFDVLECILLLMFFSNLFDGIEYTAQRNPSTKVLSHVTEASTMSVIFVIATRFLEFAPQILSLMSQEEELDLSYNAAYKMSMAQMKPYLSLACIICCLLLGIIWLYFMVRLFSGAIRDKEYNSALMEKYKGEILSDRGFVVDRGLSKIYVCLILGFIFFFDFSIDAVGVIPDVIGFILLGFAANEGAKLSEKKSPLLLTVCGTIISLIEYAFMTFTRLGINFEYGVETFNAREFSMLKGVLPIGIEAVLSGLEYALFALLAFKIFSYMKCVFTTERRKNAVSMLNIAKVGAVIMALLCTARRIFVPIMGHLASEEAVQSYIQSKNLIRTKQAYSEAMSNPLVANFEHFDSFVYVFSIVATAFTLINVLYLLHINRMTEGDK